MSERKHRTKKPEAHLPNTQAKILMEDNIEKKNKAAQFSHFVSVHKTKRPKKQTKPKTKNPCNQTDNISDIKKREGKRITISKKYIKDLLKNLNRFKFARCDENDSRALKELDEKILEPIVTIFALWIQTKINKIGDG